MIDKIEYENRLNEDKYFENFEEHYNYRFGVIEYYLFNLTVNYNNNEFNIILLPSINLSQKQLIILAFYKLKNKTNEH